MFVKKAMVVHTHQIEFFSFCCSAFASDSASPGTRLGRAALPSGLRGCCCSDSRSGCSSAMMEMVRWTEGGREEEEEKEGGGSRPSRANEGRRGGGDTHGD